jgi:exopolyphosphatase/guanosine-5'-triphosphate,3'-diphosphate pyrophosphatase
MPGASATPDSVPGAGVPPAPGPAPAYAAVDLGTHNCRLLIARAEGDGRLAVVEALSRPVRLGEGLLASGLLGAAAMTRTVRALALCAGRIGRAGVVASRAVATEAGRRAGNAAAFFARVEASTGLAVEPIDADEEARLTLLGCAPLIEPGFPHLLLFDIGGGSTDIVWAERPASGPPRLLASLSLAAGVVGFAERFGGDRISEAGFAAMAEAIEPELAAFDDRHRIGAAIARHEVQMIGTSGTVTTLAALSLGLGRYRRSRVDGRTIGFDRIAALNAALAATDRPTRAAIGCIGPDRADLVPAGCAILQAICRRWPVGRLTVADRGLREGLILALHAGRERRI